MRIKTEIIKNYINIDRMVDELIDIFTECRNEYIDDENKDYLMDSFSDEHIKQYATEMAYEFNDSMKIYLNSINHRIDGNFNNIDYDYPHHINGEVEYNYPLVNAMIDRLNAGEESEQANADRDWLVDWFWETCGSYGVRYNFSETIADYLWILKNKLSNER